MGPDATVVGVLVVLGGALVVSVVAVAVRSSRRRAATYVFRPGPVYRKPGEPPEPPSPPEQRDSPGPPAPERPPERPYVDFPPLFPCSICKHGNHRGGPCTDQGCRCGYRWDDYPPWARQDPWSV